MKHAPSATTAIITFAVFLCLGMTTQLWACSDCICLTDSTCSNDMCGSNPTANCSRLEFSPACDGVYTFHVSTNCAGDYCGGCQSCASVWKLAGGNEYFLTSCETNNCNIGGCSQDCQIELDSSTTCVLYVCKVYCPGAAGDCGECKQSCGAIACLSYGIVSTNCTP